MSLECIQCFSPGVSVSHNIVNKTVSIYFTGEQEFGLIITEVEDTLQFSLSWPQNAGKYFANFTSFLDK